MLHKAVSIIERFTNIQDVHAHCDIPCKIYDPSTAIIAALSVVRMMDILLETTQKEDSHPLQTQNTISRCIAIKEMEASKVKLEIHTIWGDYIKDRQVQKHPKVHDIVHQIMVIASTCKQRVDREAGEELVDLVNQFADIFWSTKNIETVRKTSPYPPSMQVVYPVL